MSGELLYDGVRPDNPHLSNLSKIEFVITYACTGRCIHCSEGDHPAGGANIDADIAADAVRKIAGAYPIKTVMTFGGEPLLHGRWGCRGARSSQTDTSQKCLHASQKLRRHLLRRA